MKTYDFTQPIVIADKAAWRPLAEALLAYAGETRIFLLHGELGAGKTTLVQALCEALGVQDRVNSPTFGLVHTYHRRRGEPLYHFDGYRLESTAAAEEMGAATYFDSGAYCFIEWPDLLLPLLPPHHMVLWLRHAEQGRVLQVEKM